MLPGSDISSSRRGGDTLLLTREEGGRSIPVGEDLSAAEEAGATVGDSVPADADTVPADDTARVNTGEASLGPAEGDVTRLFGDRLPSPPSVWSTFSSSKNLLLRLLLFPLPRLGSVAAASSPDFFPCPSSARSRSMPCSL